MDLIIHSVLSFNEVENQYKRWLKTDEKIRHVDLKINELIIPFFFIRGGSIYPYQHISFSVKTENAIHVATSSRIMQTLIKGFFPRIKDDYEMHSLYDTKETLKLRFFPTVSELEENLEAEIKASTEYSKPGWGKSRSCAII